MPAPRRVVALLASFLVAAATAAATLLWRAGSRRLPWPPSSGLVLAEVVTGGASASDEYVEIANAGRHGRGPGRLRTRLRDGVRYHGDPQGELCRAAAPGARRSPARCQLRGHLRPARRFHLLRRACGGRGSGHASSCRWDGHRRRGVGHGHELLRRGNGGSRSSRQVQHRAPARRIERQHAGHQRQPSRLVRAQANPIPQSLWSTPVPDPR